LASVGHLNPKSSGFDSGPVTDLRQPQKRPVSLWFRAFKAISKEFDSVDCARILATQHATRTCLSVKATNSLPVVVNRLTRGSATFSVVVPFVGAPFSAALLPMVDHLPALVIEGWCA